jgi:hypothetical protein
VSGTHDKATSGANVIRLPRQPLDPANAPRTIDGQPFTRCEDPIHVFESKEQPCQCGEHRWSDE